MDLGGGETGTGEVALLRLESHACVENLKNWSNAPHWVASAVLMCTVSADDRLKKRKLGVDVGIGRGNKVRERTVVGR